MLLVSMVGDFDSNILPLFFHHVEAIKVHVLLFDKRRSDRLHAIELHRGMTWFCEHYRYQPKFHTISYDEDNMQSIRAAFERILELGGGERLWLNASDGLASTLAVIMPWVRERDGVVLSYDRFENSCNLLDGDTMRQEVVSPMTIPDHLMLKNLDYELIDEDEAMRERKEAVFKLLERTDEYVAFREAYVKKKLDAKHPQFWMKAVLESTGRADDVMYFSGAIFEEYCYWLVKDLKFDDVRIGVKVIHAPDGDEPFQNEFDLLLIKDNHLHIIECKLRKKLDGECFIYKYDSVGNLLDADGKRMIVSVGGDNVITHKGKVKSVQFNEGNLRRARKSNIAIYQAQRMDAEAFVELVEEFFYEFKIIWESSQEVKF